MDNNIIRIPPIQRSTAKSIPVPFPRPISLDESCVLALLPGGQNSAKWQDESGQGNHGVVTGASMSSKGKHGPSYYLDGLDDIVQIGDDDTFKTLTEGSIVVWFKVTDLSSARTIFGVGPKTTSTVGLHLYYRINTDGSLYLRQRNGDDSVDSIECTLPAGTFTINNWYCLIWRVDSSLGNKLFLNGIDKTLTYLAGSSATTYFFDDINTTQNYWLGARKYNGSLGLHFKGEMDSVFIFKRALSATEILNIYNQGI